MENSVNLEVFQVGWCDNFLFFTVVSAVFIQSVRGSQKLQIQDGCQMEIWMIGLVDCSTAERLECWTIWPLQYNVIYQLDDYFEHVETTFKLD